jgi:phosphate transport system substrate-binding protein
LALSEKTGGPFYAGTLEDVVAHRYPLARFNYVILNRPPGRPIDPRLSEFLSFVLSQEGQQVVQKQGDFLPLPAEIVNEERAKLSAGDVTLDPVLPAYRPTRTVAGEIRSTGDENLQPLMKAWSDGFTKRHPAVRFSIASKGSEDAAPALVEGTADIAPIGRETTPAEAAAFEQKYGYRPLLVAVAGGSHRTRGMSPAVAIFVNKANPIEKLTLDQLDAIFSKTLKRGYPRNLTAWGQLGLEGEWLNRPITPYGLKRPAGTANYVQDRILLGGAFNDWIMEYKAPAGFDSIVASVGQDPCGVGYTDFAAVSPTAKAVPLAEKDGGPYYEGTLENVASHRYPLSRFMYVLVNRAPGKPVDPKVAEFLSFVLSREGQQAVQQQAVFLPLPAEIARQERAKLE